MLDRESVMAYTVSIGVRDYGRTRSMFGTLDSYGSPVYARDIVRFNLDGVMVGAVVEEVLPNNKLRVAAKGSRYSSQAGQTIAVVVVKAANVALLASRED